MTKRQLFSKIFAIVAGVSLLFTILSKPIFTGVIKPEDQPWGVVHALSEGLVRVYILGIAILMGGMWMDARMKKLSIWSITFLFAVSGMLYWDGAINPIVRDGMEYLWRAKSWYVFLSTVLLLPVVNLCIKHNPDGKDEEYDDSRSFKDAVVE